MIIIKLAGIPIGIDNRFAYVKKLACDYLTDEAPAFTVSATDSDIEAERAASEIEFSDGYLESIVAYRKIAERLPEYDGFVFHGAVLNYGGQAYAFTAKSGVGKTTHTGIWLSEFGDKVHYLNGDKPIIRIIDGRVYACGTPWRGKEGYGVNETAPLGAIALLERGLTNSAEVIASELGVLRLFGQIYLPKDKEMLKKTMKLADSVLKTVKFVELKCNMDREAAHVAMRSMVKNN